MKPARNNQRRGIRFAADFEIERWSLDLLRELVEAKPTQDESLASVA